MMSPSQQIFDMEPMQIDIESELEPQVKILGESCAKLLIDCGAVVNDALTAAFREVCKAEPTLGLKIVVGYQFVSGLLG